MAIRMHKLNTSETFSNWKQPCSSDITAAEGRASAGQSGCRMTFSAFCIRPGTDETGARHQGRGSLLNECQTILFVVGWSLAFFPLVSVYSTALGAFAFLPFRISWVWLFLKSAENAAIINIPEKVSR